MTGMTTYFAQGVANHMTGRQAIFPMKQAYVALFSATGADDGTGFTEFAGGGYARAATAAADWGAPSAASPCVIANANPVIFPVSTAAWGTIAGFGIFDDPGAGNLLAWDYFGLYPWQPVTIVAAQPAVLTTPRHGFLNGDTVEYSTEYGGTPPTTSQGALTGPLVVAQALTDTFQVTSGGVVVNTSTSGDGAVRKAAAQPIIANVQVTFGAGQLTINFA